MELLIQKFKCFLWVLFLPALICGELSQKELQALTPHELPLGHPVRVHLDKLFKKKSIIKNVNALKEAGFDYAGPRKHTGLIVASHFKTPGFIYKIYTDVQEYYKNRTEHELWLMRIEGVRRIREYIQDRHLVHLFKVPRKWVYIIPASMQNKTVPYPKHTILVEEQMDILSEKKNLEKWKSKELKQSLLNELYQLITLIGLRDCAKPDNIPFCKDGRIAFIDTQTFDENPVSYYRLSRSLSESNKKFWINLTQDGR